jgi:hypothetical protein
MARSILVEAPRRVGDEDMVVMRYDRSTSARDRHANGGGEDVEVEVVIEDGDGARDSAGVEEKGTAWSF